MTMNALEQARSIARQHQLDKQAKELSEQARQEQSQRERAVFLNWAIGLFQQFDGQVLVNGKKVIATTDQKKYGLNIDDSNPAVCLAYESPGKTVGNKPRTHRSAAWCIVKQRSNGQPFYCMSTGLQGSTDTPPAYREVETFRELTYCMAEGMANLLAPE
jgi:hypothetical protein